MDEYYSTVCVCVCVCVYTHICHTFFIHLSIGGHLGSFYIMVIVNSAVIETKQDPLGFLGIETFLCALPPNFFITRNRLYSGSLAFPEFQQASSNGC